MNFLQRALAACVFLAVTACATEGLAQATGKAPPAYPSNDLNGVDLSSGRLNVPGPSLSIGPSGGGLGWSPHVVKYEGQQPDSLAASMQEEVMPPFDDTIPNAPKIYTVSMPGRSQTFRHIGALGTGAYTKLTGEPGTSLTYDTPSNSFIFKDQDGTTAVFSRGLKVIGDLGNAARISSITRPTGERLDYYYTTDTKVLRSVVSNLGYMVKYATNGDVSLFNLAVDYCDPLALTCATTTSRQMVTATTGGFTDALGRTTSVAQSGPFNDWTWTVSRPGLAVATYHGTTPVETPRVVSATTASGTWAYDFVETIPDPTDPIRGTLDLTRTDPLSHTVLLHTDLFTGAGSLATDELGRQTQYYRGSQGEVTGVVYPEGNKEDYPYASVGVIKGVTRTPKVGSPLAQTASTSTFPAACTDPGVNDKTCRKPTSVTDARGAVTDYTYDLNSGQVLTETQPVGVSGVRPQTRFTYTALYAQYKNASGVLTAFATPVYKLTQTSTCAAGVAPACVGTADETRTTIAYASSNLWPTSATTGAGDDSISATTTSTYDAVGNVISVDGPLPGTADTTVFRYDVLRRKVGEVGPAFTNNLAQVRNRATRTSYHVNGQVQLVEQGFVLSQSDSDWAGFTMLSKTTSDYDSLGRQTKISQQDASTTYSVTQFSYDAVNRNICTAVRMNPAVFGLLPADACTTSTLGADGPDRILQNAYDAAGQVTQVTSGYGATAPYAPRVEKTATYTLNGREQTLADGKGNLTTYEYDGFDRLAKARYPNAACCTSSTTDFDAYGYDANDNRTTWQHRPNPGLTGQTVTYTYDALNRLIYHDGVQTWFYYDNLGRPTQTFAGASAEKVIAHYYDGLGRPSYTYDYRDGTWFPIYTGYDLAGRRTTLQWWDGVYFNYVYDAAGDLVSVVENGSSYFSNFGYDNLGRRTAIIRPNGTYSFYAYDGASRLTTLNHDLPGTAQDQTWTYTFNAGSQIKTRTSNNALYDWTPGAAVSRGYTINGLNQATLAGAATLSYDGRGNLLGDGAATYGYDIDNRLTTATTASGTTTLTYDPLGRLAQTAGTTTTRFVYSGQDLIGELDGANNIVRRHVPGDGVDEFLGSYVGSGLTNPGWRFADERGSIVAAIGATGPATINTYDEYGVPAAGNLGRFQYTGQMWLPEVGLYNYKARIYSPTLGRFLQTDPIGYGDGLNWYAYVGNDPMNWSDPTGQIAMFYSPPIQVNLPGIPVPPGLLDSLLGRGVRIATWGGGAVFDGLRLAFDPTIEPLADGTICGGPRPTAMCGVKIDDKIKGQLGDRGWTEQEVQDVSHTKPAGETRDQRGPGKTPDGQKRDDRALVYGSAKGYIVVNERTREVVQVSSKLGNWVADSRIVWH